MILVSAPLRVSFFGGGSDLKNFYKKYSGAFLSTAISHRIYLIINKTENPLLKIHYKKTEIQKDLGLIKHPIIKNALKYYNIKKNIEIASFSDFSSHEKGLGSSSAFTVALLGGLKIFNNKKFNSLILAKESCNLEINLCKEPIGLQDQYASSFGNFSFYEINKNGSVNIQKLNLPKAQTYDLQNNLFLIDTKTFRKSSSILKNQSTNYINNSIINEYQMRIVEHAYEAFELLKKGNNDDFGRLLSKSWLYKKKLSHKITNQKIDIIYKKGINAGAIGGKLLGAGGGGFFLFYVPKKKHSMFKQAFDMALIKQIKFEKEGFICHYEKI